MERRQLLEQVAALTVAVAASNTAPAREKSAEKCSATPWRSYNTPTKQEYLENAKRLPALPDPNSVPPEERADYDYMMSRNTGWKKGTTMVGGMPYGLPHYIGLTVSPPLAGEINCWGRLVMADQGRPGALDDYEHEIIDEALAFDSGYYALIAGHTPGAIGSGWRIEALEALRDHRDDLLTPEELLLVRFIRAVRDGSMTDELWNDMYKRVGNERAVLDYVHFICLLDMHHRFCWAVGAAEMSHDNFGRMLADIRSGAMKVPKPQPAPQG
jgi:hypothetical protein